MGPMGLMGLMGQMGIVDSIDFKQTIKYPQQKVVDDCAIFETNKKPDAQHTNFVHKISMSVLPIPQTPFL